METTITYGDLTLCAALAREAADLRERLTCLRSMAERTTARLSPTPGRQGPGDPVGEAVAHLAVLEEAWQRKIEAYAGHVLRVSECIDTLEDPDQRTVLRLRFIDGLVWEEIGERMHFGARWCRVLCQRGVQALGIAPDEAAVGGGSAGQRPKRRETDRSSTRTPAGASGSPSSQVPKRCEADRSSAHAATAAGE
jgi:hypothetical protein